MKVANSDNAALLQHFVAGGRNAKIHGDAVQPIWSADGSRFSYRRATREGVEYVLVDPARGTRQPLFDPAALLTGLANRSGGGAIALDALSDVALGADGASVAFVHGGRRWRAPLDTLEPSDLGPAAGPGELLSPDGTARLILAGHNLWLLDGNGARTALTNDGEGGRAYGEFLGFMSVVSLARLGSAAPSIAVWSPDSRCIATCRADTRQVLTMPMVQAVPPEGLRPRLHLYPFPMPGDEHGAKLDLLFVDRTGKQVRAKLDGLESFAFDPLAAGDGWWEDDSRHFLFRQALRDGNGVDLWRIDTHTGDAALLLRDTTPGAGRPVMGSVPLARRLSDGRILWGSEADGWQHLYLVEPGSDGPWRQVTSGPWRVTAVHHVDEAERRVTFAAQGREAGVDPYYGQLYSIGFDGSDLRRLTPEELNHSPPTAPPGPNGPANPREAIVSPDGRWFVDSFGAVDRPAVSVLRDREGGLVMQLEQADGSDSWPEDMPLPEPVHVTALDGETELWGVLYRPAGFDPRQRYPVVEIVYGAPQIAVTPKTFRQSVKAPTAEMLAALGYVTIIIDGPGTPGRSRDFQFRSYGRTENCGGLDDHVAAIRHLAETRPWMDLSRGVGITGFSGGGYATVRAMSAFPDFYTVGVSICGNHDQEAYVAGWGEIFHGLHDPESYRAQANAGIASEIRGKLFLIHGEMDDNVHPSQTLRIADALIRADVDFDLLIVPNADHGVARHPYAARRTHDFFLRHLPPPEAPKRM